MTTTTFQTNYRTATKWLNNSLILCNEIMEEETFWDYCRFELSEDTEIFQTYLTDCSLLEVELLEEHFGLLFSYSEKLDLYVLCVDHYGTSWDYVTCYTDIEEAARELGE